MNILWITFAEIVRKSGAAMAAKICPFSPPCRPQLVHADNAAQVAARNADFVLSPATGLLY
jgi:hypothetical protein